MNKQQGSAHVVVVIVLVVALLGALGFIFWQNFLKKDEPVKQTTSTKAAEKTEDAENKPTTKTFENNTFSFEYPAEGWNAKETSYDVGETVERTPEVTTTDFERNVGMGIKTGAIVSVFETGATGSLSDEKANMLQLNATEMTDTTVGGVPAISYRLDYEGTRFSTFVIRNDRSYNISYQFAGTVSSTHRDGYDTIVESFKFK